MEPVLVTPIAHVESGFTEKFGIPRQSGLVEELEARVVFEPEYRVKEAFRGLEEFSHLWLIWEFSQSVRESWSPTVRPPRLGGNRRMGVFATRSPFRPNPIGLSCVRLKEVRWEEALGPVLLVAGADLLDGTPVFDIKPYLPFADSRPEAAGGFTQLYEERRLRVEIPPQVLREIPEELREGVKGILEQDPRPSYHNDPQRVYGMSFSGMELKFRVEGATLNLLSAEKTEHAGA